MKKLTFGSVLMLMVFALQAQIAGNGAFDYRNTPEKINNLVHTKLDAKLDFPKSQLYGKVWITLSPHFYPTDSLMLDAKGMEIKQVAIVKNGKNTPLKYRYDGEDLYITLDKSYTRRDKYTVYIDYTAKPNEYKTEGSAAITDAKGLYFIDPLGTDPEKPTQVWTQGETEATSVWVPTIDKPNQKTTQEIMLTVPSAYVTLSNGKLISQKKNSDQTRTDYWKMDQPHAPYLFFIGAGDFAVVKDNYKGKEVSYYVDKEYASVARRIFGMTPEMMSYFSRLLGVEYPWVKYGQMTAHDYVSGAMENTTATLHSDISQQNARQLTDGNIWEDVIAHELFHQWFGDLVTTESWSNLPLNESFANYSEYLWREYKYGEDAADEHGYNDMMGYIGSRSEQKDLIRFDYRDKEDMFDAVSYNKGGRILHMLREFVGDSAFFRSLNKYLVDNKYKAAEAHQLRLAFEEVTGKDLNWFWNQWFFGAGHPELNIRYNWLADAKQVQMIVEQTQEGDKVFTLPVTVDVYHGSTPARYTIWVDSKSDTFNFASMTKPDLVNFDANKVLLAEKTENKTLDEYIFQYRNARNYLDRREAVDAALRQQEVLAAAELLMEAAKDPYEGLRSYTINRMDLSKEQIKSRAENLLYTTAQKDKDKMVKAAAINKLGTYKSPQHLEFFKKMASDSSYSVAGNALEAVYKQDTTAAYVLIDKLKDDENKGRLASVITNLTRARTSGAGDDIVKQFEATPFGQDKFELLGGVFEMMAMTTNLEEFKRSVDAVVKFQTEIPEQFREQIATALNAALGEIAKEKRANGMAEMATYAESKIPKPKES